MTRQHSFASTTRTVVLLMVVTRLSLVLFTGCGASTAQTSYSIEAAKPLAPTAAMAMPAPPIAAGLSAEGYAASSLLAPEYQVITVINPQPVEHNTEQYERIVDNPFKNSKENPVSTFSIDVDTASYANIRRFLMEMREMPPADAVRIEELVNYFQYDYPEVTGEHPVAASFSMSTAPWNNDHWLLRIALQAKEIAKDTIPASNLVFLLDTSGSMSDDNKLPLIQESLKILVEQLRPEDRVSIVAYAGSTGVILDSTPGDEKETIIRAFEQLQASGSTAGGAGIQLAYQIAKQNFITGGNNRVILCTDGDFNVGVSSESELERLIEDKRKDAIYLTVLGVGMGNYKDSLMETLADKGNGNYAYLDNLLEGKKVLGKEIWGNMYTVAKDVKIQIEFNPAVIREYRLIGYENRLLAREDFNDDTKDAGEMGSGQTVTAFYELVPVTAPQNTAEGQSPAVDPLVFQQSTIIPSEDALVFKLRYKHADGTSDESTLVSTRLKHDEVLKEFSLIDEDFRFSTAVIEFGMLLRKSPYTGTSAWETAIERARIAKGSDYDGYRAEFIKLAEMAELLTSR